MSAVATLPVEEVEQNTPEEEETQEVPSTEEDPIKDREDLQREITALAKKFIGFDKWVRRQEVIEARRQRFYWRNEQYIYWKSDAVGFVPASGGTSVVAGNMSVEIPRYTDSYNIYTPYGESIMATLIQNPPGVNWQPIDPTKAEDITASQTAEKFQQKIEKENDRKKLQTDIARLFYTDGRTVLHTRRSEGEEGPTELITAHGVLESRIVPITATKKKDVVAVFLSEEIDICQAKADNPDYASKIVEGTSSLGESAYERIARLGVLQGTRLLMQAGDAFSHMVTHHEVYLRVSTLDRADKKLRDELKQLFPNGIYASFCGDTYCGSKNVSLDDHIAIGFPTPGDGMSRPSMGKRMVPVQDSFNDELNLWHEAHDYCVPTLFMYSETGDIEAVREQISQPGNIVPVTALPPGAQSIESAFYAAVLEAIPATLPQLITFFQGPLAQFITGAFPALFGGDTGTNDTGKGIAIQRDQAMGRMGIPWSSLQSLFAEAYHQAAMDTVRNDTSEGTFTYSAKDRAGNTVNESLSIADLKNGSFKCVPDTDSAFPETTNAKRSMFQTLMTAAERNPILADVMAQPDNMEMGHELLGLPDLMVPGAEARNKQLIEIDQLLKEGPTPPDPQEVAQAVAQNPQLAAQMKSYTEMATQAQASGKEPPPPPLPPEMFHSTIPVDPVWDFHQYESQTIKDWLSSPACRKEQLKGNFKGIANVKAHGAEHNKYIPPPPPPDMTGKSKPGSKAAAPVLANPTQAQPATGAPAQ